MNPEKKYSSKWQFLGIGILLILLPVLAVLQYHWLGQLSEAEKIRMQSNLKISAERFSEEFDKQMTSIYRAFNEINFENSSQKSTLLSDTYSKWRENTNIPQLIDSIYIIKIDADSNIHLKKLNETKKTLIEIPWPKHLYFLNSFFLQDMENIFLRLVTLTHGPVLTPQPFILITQPSEIIIDSMTKNCTENWVILITLNKKILLNQFIPHLVNKYFSIQDELNYQIIIAKRGEQDEIFYQSDIDLSLENFKKPDARTKIGSWRLENLIIASAEFVDNENETMNVNKVIKEKSLSIQIYKGDTLNNVEKSNYLIAKLDRWELLVKHKSGTLESIIKQTRIKNLIISYLILIILGVGVIVTFLSARKMQKIGQQKMDFVAAVTHELRTPLAVIQSAGENIIDGILKTEDQFKKYGTLIRDEGRRLSKMVEQILDYSGIQSKNSQNNFEALNLIEIFNELKQRYNNHINFEIVDAPKNPIVNGHKTALLTAFGNITDNAIKYSPNESPINVSISRNKKDNFYKITINDKGMGINQDEINSVFEPFYRGKNAIENTIPGSGLGLSLVKGIIDNHGGQITIISKKNEGTTCKILLPVYQDNKD